MTIRKPVFLLILDGFGIKEAAEDNAVSVANTKNLDRIFSTYPFTTIHASNGAVGLPKGYIGSSEVGHMNIGAGRLVLQSLAKINKAIETHTLKDNEVLKDALKKAKDNGRLHLLGLLSDGGVHSHIEHLLAIIELAKGSGIKEVYIHAFLDGRDVEPRCAERYVSELEDYCEEIGVGEIASIHGRFYAMDRDKRWDRVKESYDCLTKGIGFEKTDATRAIKSAYERGETDEFVKPTIIKSKTLVSGANPHLIRNGDTVIHFNFREDRARELTQAFVEEDFKGFDRIRLENINYVCMTKYYEELKAPIMFPFSKIKNTLGEYLSREGLKQLRIAETEKYAHVTYFFSGGEEKPFEGEERILIPSNDKVKTYDQAPEMRTREIATKAIEFVREHRPELVVCNIAAPDMVGHTGVFSAVVKAVELVDVVVGEIEIACKSEEYVLVITADHGNCEEMSGKYKTSHTLNPVPFCIIEHDEQGKMIPYKLMEKEKGVLGDISPTILRLMSKKIPEEMDNSGLVVD